MYLGIDLGTSSIKAILLKGDMLIEERMEYPAELAGKTEQNPLELENVFIAFIGSLKTKYDLLRSVLRGICLCGHGPSILFCDSSARPLTSLLTWEDRRAEKEAEEIRRSFETFRGDATSYEAKVLWFYRRMPHLFNGENKILYLKDYLVFKLTGKAFMDRSTASTIHFYDRRNNKWKFSELGIPDHLFPQTLNSWDQAGVTSTAFSSLSGLEDDIPVYAGGIDAYCEALGAGAVEPGDIVDGTGTSTCISMCLEERENEDLHVIPDRSLKIEMISSSGRSVNWILNLLSERRENIEELDLSNPVPLLFLPYLIGERSPVWDEKAMGAIIGLTESTGRAEIIKAVLQGTAFSIKQNLELITLNEVKVEDSVRAVGGGAVERWLELKTNVTGKIYKKMKVKDSAALGAAILAAYGKRDDDFIDIVRRSVKTERVFYPDKKRTEQFHKLYRIYTGLYSRLKDCFHSLSDFGRNNAQT